MNKNMKAVSAALMALFSAGAEAGVVQAPSSGQLLNQIPTFEQPSESKSFDLPKRERKRFVVKEGTSFEVDRIVLEGNKAFPSEALLKIGGFVPKSKTTLNGLRQIAWKIADYYRSKGYFLAHAAIPTQDVRNGTVKIVVEEGVYGKISKKGDGSLSPRLQSEILGNLKEGKAIEAGSLESDLLILSDMPGMKIHSTLSPGSSFGQSDLEIDSKLEKRVGGSLSFDNAGNPYTGADRASGSVVLNEPFGVGDKLELDGVDSGSGMQYGKADYSLHAGKATIGASYAQMKYALGGSFAYLGASGSAEIASAYASYPLIRSRRKNLSLEAGYDSKTFNDQSSSASPIVGKRAGVFMVGATGSEMDDFGRGGMSEWSVIGKSGRVSIGDPSAAVLDASTSRSAGSYEKAEFMGMRDQNLGRGYVFHASISGQAASKNLDVSEKMELGGMNGVRAYPEGEAYGDEGYVSSIELRKDVKKPSFLSGTLTASAFVDHGYVKLNADPWLPGPNTRSLSGMGLGLTWRDGSKWQAKAYAAGKIGSAKATSAPDSPVRFWFQLTRFF